MLESILGNVVKSAGPVGINIDCQINLFRGVCNSFIIPSFAEHPHGSDAMGNALADMTAQRMVNTFHNV